MMIEAAHKIGPQCVSFSFKIHHPSNQDVPRDRVFLLVVAVELVVAVAAEVVADVVAVEDIGLDRLDHPA